MALNRIRVVLVVAAALGALALSGCAAKPDLTPLETHLAEVEGVNGAMAYTTHSGAPWNTQIVVLLFLDDPSDEGVIASVRAAAPVLAADPAASRHEVSLSFIDGDRADYESRSQAFADDIVIMPVISETLGVRDTGTGFLTLSPDDIRRIAASE